MAKTNDPNLVIVQLPIPKIHPAPFNRPARTGFDAKSIKELADSIVAQGIIQPLVARPHPTKKGEHEIVCGERRWTAAKQAKLDTVPCVIRDLTDTQARELNLLENLQRVDVHPIEEAQGYADLLELRTPDGKQLYTIEHIVTKVGKSAAWVYARLKLLKLADFAQQALYSGKLNASVALLLCRIPDPKLAFKAAIEVLDKWGQGKPEGREANALDPERDAMSYRAAKSHITDKYMTRLKGAPFDQEDAELVPVEFSDVPIPAGAKKEWVQTDPQGVAIKMRTAGGACSTCPCRTGNMKALFGDVDSADVCTNTACYRRKKDCTLRNQQRAHKEKGELLLSTGKVQGIISGGWNGRPPALVSTDYIDLKAKVPGKKVTFGEALEEHLPEGTLIHIAKSGAKKFTLLPRDVATTAAKAAGITLPKGEPDQRVVDREADNLKRQAKIDKACAVAAAACQAIYQKALATKPDLKWWRWLAAAVFEGTHRREQDWAETFGFKTNKEMFDHLAKATEGECIAALIACRFLNDPIDWQGTIDENIPETCAAYGLNFDKIKATAEDAFKAAQDAAAKAAKSAEAKPVGADKKK